MERTESERAQTEERQRPASGSVPRPGDEVSAPEYLSPLEKARRRMLEAAIAYCDGLISSGQLKAVREMLREQERASGVRAERPPKPAAPVREPRPPASTREPTPRQQELRRPPETEPPAPPELKRKLDDIDRKLTELERAFRSGEVNSAQFQAVKRHYEEQRQVAVELHRAHPSSDRWRVVLEEGKTVFLMRLNEAACQCVAFYDLHNQERLHVQGVLPRMAEEAVAFLQTFGARETEDGPGRMYATHTDEGHTLMLIPGRYTAALVVFSEDPPSWQVRALREVQRNFELANRAALARGERRALVYPNMKRFIKA